jgi:hypothetical protein
MIPASRELLLLLLAGALAGGQIVPTSAALAASTAAPGNTLGTGTSAWFGLNATGGTICTGVNATLACPFGSRPIVGTFVASATVAVKAASRYRVTVVNGAGPAGIATIVTVAFASTGAANATLPAGATDTITITLRIRVGTALGTYTGTILVTDRNSGITASFPISVTH